MRKINKNRFSSSSRLFYFQLRTHIISHLYVWSLLFRKTIVIYTVKQYDVNSNTLKVRWKRTMILVNNKMYHGYSKTFGFVLLIISLTSFNTVSAAIFRYPFRPRPQTRYWGMMSLFTISFWLFHKTFIEYHVQKIHMFYFFN